MGILNVFSLSEDEKKSFISRYEQFYYNEEQYSEDEGKLLGTVLKNKTEKSVEKYADEVLSGKGFDKRIFLWKAGRLTVEQAAHKDAESIRRVKVLNGRGHEIENAEDFIDGVIKEMEMLKGNDSFQVKYEKLLDISKQTQLKNVGAVYLITVLFFLSNKEYPIYDYYAHRAVKALYLDKIPSEVFVGAAPAKTELYKVVAMYNEYKFLLEQVFGYSSIERELDRALWVYGHANNQGEKWSLTGRCNRDNVI